MSCVSLAPWRLLRGHRSCILAVGRNCGQAGCLVEGEHGFPWKGQDLCLFYFIPITESQGLKMISKAESNL